MCTWYFEGLERAKEPAGEDQTLVVVSNVYMVLRGSGTDEGAYWWGPDACRYGSWTAD